METINDDKPIVYIDMDNVLVDFKTGIEQLEEDVRKQYDGVLDEVPGIFSLMNPMPGAIESVRKLEEHYDLYVLSTAPWLNSSAWSDKVKWIQKHFGAEEGTLFYKKLIISHHKNLNHGAFLIDDRIKNGAGDFNGELILFGSDEFPDWRAVTKYLLGRIE